MTDFFNRCDRFDFDWPASNFVAAIGEHASWGYFDPGKSHYADGSQCRPTNWTLSTPRKRALFAKVKEITGDEER